MWSRKGRYRTNLVSSFDRPSIQVCHSASTAQALSHNIPSSFDKELHYTMYQNTLSYILFRLEAMQLYPTLPASCYFLLSRHMLSQGNSWLVKGLLFSW